MIRLANDGECSNVKWDDEPVRGQRKHTQIEHALPPSVWMGMCVCVFDLLFHSIYLPAPSQPPAHCSNARSLAVVRHHQWQPVFNDLLIMFN